MEGFEIIDASEFEAATKAAPRTKRKTKSVDDLERTKTNWFTLHTQLGTCTMPEHMAVMEMMDELAKEYRRVYPLRMVLKREDDVYICRDCWVRGY